MMPCQNPGHFAKCQIGDGELIDHSSSRSGHSSLEREVPQSGLGPVNPGPAVLGIEALRQMGEVSGATMSISKVWTRDCLLHLSCNFGPLQDGDTPKTLADKIVTISGGGLCKVRWIQSQLLPSQVLEGPRTLHAGRPCQLQLTTLRGPGSLMLYADAQVVRKLRQMQGV